MTVFGHLQDGIVVLDSPQNFPNGTTVRVEIPETVAISTAPTEPERKTLYERFESFIGTAPELPSDASINHDHYLYGTPKRS